MNRDNGLFNVLAIMGGFLLLILVTCGPFAGGRGRPTEPQPGPVEAPAAAPDADPQLPRHDRAWELHMTRLYAHFFAEDAGPDRPSDVLESAPLDLSGLTPARLRQLNSQRLRMRVITDSRVWRVGDRDVFEAVMKEGEDDLATVWMYANPDVEDGMTVEGRLRVVHHPTISAGATTVKAFTEYRMVDAVQVGS